MFKRAVCILTVLAIAAVMIAACGGPDTPAPGGPQAPQPPTQASPQPQQAPPPVGDPVDWPPPANDAERIARILGSRVLAPLSPESQRREVNLGYYNCDHMTAAPTAYDSGIYTTLGLNVSMTGHGGVPEAMAAGHMDVGYIDHLVALTARNVGTPLIIAAENHSGGSIYMVASHDIRTPQDLIGKRLGIHRDPPNHLNWMEWTAEWGIPSDVSYYENFIMSDADEYLALVIGELDAFITCDPWASMAEYEGTGWIMIRQNTARPTGQGTCCKVVMHSDFASRFPDLAARVILAHTMSIQFMYMFPYRAAEIFSDNFHMPLEVSLMTLYRKLNYEGRTIRWDVNREYYQNQLDTMRAYGVRPDIYDINLDGYIDLTYFNMSGADDFETFIREMVDPVFPLGMSFDEWRAKAVEVDGIVE